MCVDFEYLTCTFATATSKNVHHELDKNLGAPRTQFVFAFPQMKLRLAKLRYPAVFRRIPVITRTPDVEVQVQNGKTTTAAVVAEARARSIQLAIDLDLAGSPLFNKSE